MTYRIEVLAHKDDGRGKQIEKILTNLGKTTTVRVVDVYSSENEKLTDKVFIDSVTNPVTQEINAEYDNFDWALEIGFLPGVTDNVGHTASEFLKLAGAENDNQCFSSRLYLISGNISKPDIESLSHQISNTLIQRISIKDAQQFANDQGMDHVLPKVQLNTENTLADAINLNVSDEDLSIIGSQGIINKDGTRRGPLGMSLLYMKAVQEYFSKEGRNPTDIELETLAQTWSENCKHPIFASPIDEISDGLYKHYIKRATKEIRAERGKDDICVSVFSDNAGAIIFDDEYLICDKV